MRGKQRIALLACRLWVGVALLVCKLRKRRGSIRRTPDGRLRMAMVGPLMSANWVDAHVSPIVKASGGSLEIFVFAARPMPVRSAITLITPAAWLVKLIGGWPARSLYFLYWVFTRRPDIIMGLHLPWNGTLSLMAAKLIGARIVYFCVGGPEEFLEGGIHSENRMFEGIGAADPAMERKLVQLINQFDHALTMGTRTAAALRKAGVTIPMDPISVGINLRRFVPDSTTSKSIDVITVARLAPIKRIDVLMQSLWVTRKVQDNIRAMVIGDGTERQALEHSVSQLALAPNVNFAGWCEHVEQFLPQARMFVLTSKSEGLPIALLEAMACGVPAVVPRTGDIEDVVHDGSTGFIVDDCTPQGFAAGIQKMLSLSEADYRKVSRNAAEAAARYSLDVKEQEWRRLLNIWTAKAS